MSRHATPRRTVLGVVALLVVLSARPVGGATAPVSTIRLDGVISPVTLRLVETALARAQAEKAQALVIELDTPGGLERSMRAICQRLLNAEIPVVVWVGPTGARAASAGVFITLAAHVAAMAPATNIGAAHPVAVGGGVDKESMRKIENDAAAFVRTIAAERGRNADWAEKAVRESVSLSAQQALKLKVIDHVAADVPELLKKLGKADAPVVEVEVDWRTRVLGVLTNPAIAYIMILVGIYALIFEFMNPGLVLPGVVGAICLLLALYAFHLLPVNYAGLALILLGIAFMIAEAFLPAFGSLGVGGLLAFVIGSVILLDETEIPGFEIPYGLIAGVTVASAAFLFFVIGLAVRNRKRPVVTGREYLIGARAEALEDFDAEGWARVQGETWRVRSGAPVRRGQRLRVTSIDGLILTVEAEA
jgi:membrane-bound serine protease (ClpP class)